MFAVSCIHYLYSQYHQHKTIESVLQRGEKLDNLVDRSNQLSMQSKAFYKTAKKVRCITTTHTLTILIRPSAKLLLRCHVNSSHPSILHIPSIPPRTRICGGIY